MSDADTLPVHGTLDPGAGLRERTVLVNAWSVHDPGRAGELIEVPASGAVVLGRGVGDGQGRAPLSRQRPGGTEARPALDDPHLSRTAAALSRDGDRIVVESQGRQALRVRGQPVERAVLSPGDVVEVADRLVLLAARRPGALPPSSAPVQAFGEPDRHGIVGETPTAWLLREQLHRVGAAERHVLVLGESGTGKELAARAIHAASGRGDSALVARNAATLPESLVDAELFGHARDYPQKGMPERRGLIGQAHRSTLFLDEIGELPVALQAHLLRVLDAGEYQRLGETRTRTADLRLVCATNRDPEALKHDFRARLTLSVQLRPLRDRRADVPLLIRHLLQRAGAEDPALTERFTSDSGEPRVSTGLVAALMVDALPLNARSLERALWQSLVTSPGSTLRLTPEVQALLAPSPESGPRRPDEITGDVLLDAMERHGGKRSRVWRELGLKDRYVLRRLLKKYEAEGYAFPSAEG